MPAQAKKPILGNLLGHDTINGTPGDDFIVAFGPDSTILTNGGADFINAGNGGALVLIGGPADPAVATGTTTVNLAGTANVVESYLGRGAGEIPGSFPFLDQPVYTGDLFVVGYAGGNSVIAGEGNTHVSLGGTGNTVHVGGGTSLIRLTGGGNTVTIGSDVNAYAVNDTVSLAGLANTVSNVSNALSRFGAFDIGGTLKITGGGGNGTFTTGGADTVLTTTGLHNVVNVGDLGTDVIAPGDGSDTINLGRATSPFTNQAANATITLKGQYNVIHGLAASATITGGDGNNVYFLRGNLIDSGGNSPFDYGVTGLDPSQFDIFYNRTYTINAPGFRNGFELDDTNRNTIVAGSGNDEVEINHPRFVAQSDPVPSGAAVPTKLATITLSGNHNLLGASDGDTNVVGIGSYSNLNLGGGTNNIAFIGAHNEITIANVASDGNPAPVGHSTINAGTGQDTVTLTGGVNTVTFHGSDNLLLLYQPRMRLTLREGIPISFEV